MDKKALFVWGGWDGHTPKACVDILAPWLADQGYDVRVSDTLDAYLETDYMASLSLVVQCWTMGQITADQQKGLLDTIASGVGMAGWHGGMCDSFRNNTQYQWMTGGQWVAHPGGCIPSYDVNIVDHDHEITRGLEDFVMKDTEQYYMHVDPSNNVLATTTFENGCVCPAVWTRPWQDGKVFYTSLGHTDKDFGVPEVSTIVQRGMLWASR